MGNKALLIIDIQEDYTGINSDKKTRYSGADELVMRVNKIIEESKRNGMDIIYIKQEFAGVIPVLLTKLFSHGTAIKGKPGTEFDKRLNIISNNCFSKSVPSAFSNDELKKYLKENKIEELDVVGLDGQFCVKETIKAAIKENYHVNLISNAVLFKNENKRQDVFENLKKLGVQII
ncbi:isochorismatase family cysteine hydrolase [Clostridium sp. SM-530-WT-3G]|uniref:isochorismatase family cysteine hydrolase n=1 Tax=Clostridium sp. SM-530-WT-3G TaxID=2725303 RepID=UPI00145C644B|nr:isochorismatase family cysteine hydrolase [Clostridium sp. SM-530-WT-3G]NME83507.1 cysteine hydrolase [Clostridium sp. SM-530-WT-3G]